MGGDGGRMVVGVVVVAHEAGEKSARHGVRSQECTTTPCLAKNKMVYEDISWIDRSMFIGRFLVDGIPGSLRDRFNGLSTR